MRSTENYRNFLSIFFHLECYLVENVQRVEQTPFRKHEAVIDG
jgi:hypothetical protein